MSDILPVTNKNGYFEIRLESIGGLGANLCGKMLGELGALYLSLNASSFSSYGSEKRGSPVKAFIRWCKKGKEIRINSPVTNPHILCIFHEGLLGKHPVLNGIGKDTIIILNTALSPQEAKEKWALPDSTLFCIDALKIAMESKSRINMVLFGAIVKACNFISLDTAKQLCSDTIGQKYPGLLNANLEGIEKGFFLSASSPSHTPSPQNADRTPKKDSFFSGQQFTWGYDNAPLGGINPRAGSSVSNDLSPSREGYIPLFLPEKCIHCGLCDSTCPDMVFQFKPGEINGRACMVNTGLDYYHCKGCLRCVKVCPTGALVKALEKDYPQKPWFVPNKDLLQKHPEYEKTGPNSWVTSDSYLNEKRVDGGIV